ncbi:MAG: ABC transporter permease [Monoglobales bacterium]
MITSLAKSRIKYNKSRTILTAIAIMLTTMLLMGLGTSAVGLLDFNRQQASASSNVHAALKNLTADQVDMLKNHVDVESLETSEIFATVEYGKMNGFLTYTQDIKSGIYHGIGKLIEGRYAEASNEICGPKAFFKRLDTEPVIGNTVTISFRPEGEGKIETRDFVICGIVSEREVSNLDISDTRIAYGASVSEELVNEFIPQNERVYNNTSIRVTGEDKLNYDEIENKIMQIASDIGCDEKNVDLNNEYLFTMTDPGTEMAGIVFGIAALIIVFSGLVIYSIYYVGVITDVQEIGKLKALGSSKKQIRNLLLTEGMFISGIAIPIGVILGFLIPYFILPIVIKWGIEVSVTAFSIESLHMFSFPVLIAVIVVSLFTVYISLLKPMRMAEKISPIEAIRYQESSIGKKLRKGNINVNVFRLSTANLLRNKRRTAVTMITMGLSCVLFMSLAGALNSMSAEDIARRNIEKGDFRLALNYSLNDREYTENNLDSLQKKNIFSDDFVDQVQSIDGVKMVERHKESLVGSQYQSEMFEEGKRRTMSTLTREEADEFQKEVKQGKIDYDKLIEEHGAIFTSDTFLDEYGFTIGDTIPLVIYNGDGQIPFEIKISASIDDGGTADFLIPQEVYDSLNLNYDSTAELFISVDKDKYDNVKTAMQEIEKTNEYFRLYSYDEEIELGAASVNVVKYPMYAILLMIAVIGFMNLINTMVTSIITRKRELGVLQAIGLSNKQLTKMLAGEGMVFIAGTLLASVTLGNILGYLIFLWAKNSHFMSVSAYHYPLMETIALASVLVIGQLLITYFINKCVNKESLIDRIRNGE